MFKEVLLQYPLPTCCSGASHVSCSLHLEGAAQDCIFEATPLSVYQRSLSESLLSFPFGLWAQELRGLLRQEVHMKSEITCIKSYGLEDFYNAKNC